MMVFSYIPKEFTHSSIFNLVQEKKIMQMTVSIKAGKRHDILMRKDRISKTGIKKIVYVSNKALS